MLLTSCREALFHISRIRQLSILAIAMSLQVQGVDSDDDEVEFVGEPACEFVPISHGLKADSLVSKNMFGQHILAEPVEPVALLQTFLPSESF